MANVVFKKGMLSALPAQRVEGTFYITTDERAIYLDVNGTDRIRIGDFQEFATLDALKANANPSTTALYYVDDINCLAKWNGSEYIQINRDTGMTSVEVTGTGNAITAAVYDATGRKLTLTKGATYMTASDVDGKISAKVGDIGDKTVKEYVDKATDGIASDAALTALDERVTAAEGDIDALELKVGTETVSKQIDDKIAALDLPNTYDAKGASAAVDAKLTAEVNRATAAEQANATAAAEAKAEAEKKVASVGAKDASVIVDSTVSTNPKVGVRISAAAGNALSLDTDGLKVVIPTAAEYSVVKDTDSGDYAAVYHLTKDGANVGAAINIPKDMVVKSGSVVTNPEGQAAGTYIKLVLQNVTDPLYIDVGSLIEYVTSGSSVGDMIVVSVSDDHKVTATITDGTITKAKLDAGVQTSLNKADSAVQPADLADLNAASHTHDNKAELDKIAAGDKAKWDAAEQNAKSYADGLNNAMGERVKAIEDDHLKAADKTELEGKISAEAQTARAAEQANASAIAAEADRATKAEAKALEDAKAYTDSMLTWGSF